jgi:GT2 family glycosyltransferase
MDKENVYIIIPVHNRKAITLKCLDILRQNGDIDKYYIVVVDDGSTDGTSEAIKSLYSDVIILAGDGNLWWTGAIKKGMDYAYKHGADYFIWLNDDCYPQKQTICKILALSKNNKNWIVSAQSIDPDTGETSYGGLTIRHRFIELIKCTNSTRIECDCFNGNLVCFPKHIIDTIGYPDDKNFKNV